MGITRVRRSCQHVDIGVDTTVAWIGIAYLQHAGRKAGLVDQVMAIGLTGFERRAVTGAQGFLACIGDQSELSFYYPNKLVLVAVPMPLTRPTARRNHRQVDA